MADIGGRVLALGRYGGLLAFAIDNTGFKKIRIFGDYYIIQVDFASKLCLTRREMKSNFCIELKN
jgi:hypothetical protein